MPDQRKVVVEMTSSQRGGQTESFVLRGVLHRKPSGWVLMCRDDAGKITPTDVPAVQTELTSMMLIVRERELTLKRQGTVAVEMGFRLGVMVPGSIASPYGAMHALATMTRLDVALSEAGGTITWDYDLQVQDEAAGSFQILLHIREEKIA